MSELTEIRYVTQLDDRLAISKVYEESWKYAYQGIVPQDYLDSIPAGQWGSRIEQADRKNLVMVQDGIIIGTSGFGKSRIEEMNGFGEIISLYFFIMKEILLHSNYFFLKFWMEFTKMPSGQAFFFFRRFLIMNTISLINKSLLSFSIST